MCLFSSKFEVSHEREQHIMRLDPDAEDFAGQLAETLGREISSDDVAEYQEVLRSAGEALMPVGSRPFTVDELFPRKEWRMLALAGYMVPDPYTGAPGTEKVSDDTYRVTSYAATRLGMLEVTLTLRLMEPFEEMRMVFSPLLDRFYAGQDFRNRAVKISDSGRIRNELQTLASEAIEYLPDDRMRVRWDLVGDAVLPNDKKALIDDVLHWYKTNHQIWFKWLELE
jgi:hypothetical protein